MRLLRRQNIGLISFLIKENIKHLSIQYTIFNNPKGCLFEKFFFYIQTTFRCWQEIIQNRH